MYVCYKNMSLFSGDWAEDDDYFFDQKFFPEFFSISSE